MALLLMVIGIVWYVIAGRPTAVVPKPGSPGDERGVTFAGELLAAFRGTKALVVGDLMLDEYIFGRATRISQEAPVMVVKLKARLDLCPAEQRTSPAIWSRWAPTPKLWVCLVKIHPETPWQQPCASTDLTDFRFGARWRPAYNAQDARAGQPLPSGTAHRPRRPRNPHLLMSKPGKRQKRALSAIPGVQVVLISDYLKGAVTQGTIAGIVQEAAKHAVPVVANPKPQSLPFYLGAALVSLNQYEAGVALGLGRGVAKEEAESAAAQLRERLGVDRVLITLGANGMAAATAEATFAVPALSVEVYDEAGAGDTVIATIALGVGANRFDRKLLEVAALTAAAVVQIEGVAVPSCEDLARIDAVG